MLPPIVDGATRLLGIIGDPIAQARAPLVWSGLFRRNGINAVCVPLRVPAAEVPRFFDGVRRIGNLAGFIVTIPHKPAALHLVEDPSPRARLVGAVNVVAFDAGGRAKGDILDGVGCVAGLRARGGEVSGRRALVVGSGGVGTAIAFEVAAAGAREVVVSDVAADRAADLAARIAATGVPARAGSNDPAGFDLVMNCSPMGMKLGDPLPVDPARLEPGAIVTDVVVHPEITPLLAAARERGCFVQPGKHQMDHQIALMADFFGFGAGDWSPEAIAGVAGA